MLLSLTYHCSMNCNHCMSDCTQDNSHCTLEQFEKNLEYCLDTLQPRHDPVIVVSGGEPFEHPQIKDILSRINDKLNSIRSVVGILIATNGYKLANNPELYSWYREFCKYSNHAIHTQVTSVKDYYPVLLTDKNKYHLSKIKRLTICDSPNDIQLYPQGRALSLDNPTWMTKGPKCSNLRLLANQLSVNSFKKLVQFMPLGKYCTPLIRPDGKISLGESKLCPIIGSIEDDDHELFIKTKNCRCNKCSISMDILKSTNPIAYNLIMED